ncbi:hypothetical protein PR048_006110 [Dryococelus australis]|uniref:MADF domain-containing protein n=1 Tax=Dryococelus australis TaxID=614101 RepID=A0ABQ9IAM1_9NEOP|nr:hypothetical protein PR048_006110 [Dryococelus australis]
MLHLEGEDPRGDFSSFVPKNFLDAFGKLLQLVDPSSAIVFYLRVIEVWSTAGMKGRGKLEIPGKTLGPAESSGMIPPCENTGVARPEIEPVLRHSQTAYVHSAGVCARFTGRSSRCYKYLSQKRIASTPPPSTALRSSQHLACLQPRPGPDLGGTFMLRHRCWHIAELSAALQVARCYPRHSDDDKLVWYSNSDHRRASANSLTDWFRQGHSPTTPVSRIYTGLACLFTKRVVFTKTFQHRLRSVANMSDDFKQTLIAAVSKRTAIWDQRHADHHNRFKWDVLWEDVARTCRTTGSTAIITASSEQRSAWAGIHVAAARLLHKRTLRAEDGEDRLKDVFYRMLYDIVKVPSEKKSQIPELLKVPSSIQFVSLSSPCNGNRNDKAEHPLKSEPSTPQATVYPLACRVTTCRVFRASLVSTWITIMAANVLDCNELSAILHDSLPSVIVDERQAAYEERSLRAGDKEGTRGKDALNTWFAPLTPGGYDLRDQLTNPSVEVFFGGGGEGSSTDPRSHRDVDALEGVTEWLTCSPPTEASRVQSPPRSLPHFRKWDSCLAMPLVCGFSRRSPISASLSFPHCSILTSITLIGSQDLAVKSHPNLFMFAILKTSDDMERKQQGRKDDAGRCECCGRGVREREGRMKEGGWLFFSVVQPLDRESGTRRAAAAGRYGRDSPATINQDRGDLIKSSIEVTISGERQREATVAEEITLRAAGFLERSSRKRARNGDYGSSVRMKAQGKQEIHEKKNTLTNGIVRHDSHMRKFGSDPVGNCTRIHCLYVLPPFPFPFPSSPLAPRSVCAQLVPGAEWNRLKEGCCGPAKIPEEDEKTETDKELSLTTGRGIKENHPFPSPAPLTVLKLKPAAK